MPRPNNAPPIRRRRRGGTYLSAQPETSGMAAAVDMSAVYP